jgi:integrase
MPAVGRRRTKHKNLPPRLHLKRGRYYYGRNQEFVGDNLADALRLWAEKEAALAGDRPHTFGDLGAEYRRRVMPTKTPRTRKDNEQELARLLMVFATAPLAAVQPSHVAGYLENRPAKVRGNREVSLLSAIWNWGRGAGLTNLPNPCAGVKRNKESGRDKYVTDDELRAEWATASWPLQDALDLHYLTGQRPADVLRMSLTDIRDGCLPVRQGKTGKPLRLALHNEDGTLSELGAVIDRIKARTFPPEVVVSLALVRNEHGQRMTYSALEQRHARARKRAGVAFNLQDLRAKHGTDREELEGLLATRRALGHASVTMTERYVRNRAGAKINPLRLRTDRGIADKG